MKSNAVSSKTSATVALNGKRLVLDVVVDDGIRYVLDEIFNKHCYEVVPFVTGISNIVDVGANIGLASAWFRLAYPKASIIAFEPDRNALEILRNNAGIMGAVTVHPFGLYNGNRNAEFFTGRVSTVHSSIHTNSLSGEQQTVELRDAATAIREHVAGAIDILKIDTEGCEVAVLTSLNKMIESIKIIYLEFHSEADRRHIDGLLSRTHQLYSGNIIQAHRGQFTYVRRDLLSFQINPQIEPLPSGVAV